MVKNKNRWILVVVGVVGGIFALSILPLLFRTYVLQAFRMPSGSMRPTLLVGDYFLADKAYARTKTVDRGDILIFEFPKDNSKMFIKRVIGLPGDVIELKNKELYINEELVKEDYVIHTDSHVFDGNVNYRDNLGPIIVPDNSYFMMGDNRDESNDSRYWGFLHSSKIKGKADRIYWSWDKINYQVRWNRIGKSVN